MNKIRISKDVENYLKGVYDQGYTKEMFLNAVAINRNKMKAVEGSSLRNFVKETKFLTLFDIAEILKGDYEVECGKEEQVINAYKENKKIYEDSPISLRKSEAKGFMKAINLMNELYELNINLEGE